MDSSSTTRQKMRAKPHSRDSEFYPGLRLELNLEPGADHLRRIADLAEQHQVDVAFDGMIDWSAFVERLRRAGYDGVLSIEHKDPLL